MAWYMTGIAVVGSLAGSASQNKAAGKAFTQNTVNVKKSLDTQFGQLEEQMQSSNDSVRLEMAAQRFAGLADSATTSNVIVERNISGNLATKAYEQSHMNQMMAHNVLAKKAEDNMVAFGVEMENAQANANSAIYAGQATAASNSVSSTAAITGAIGAGIQGYSMGKSFSGGGD